MVMGDKLFHVPLMSPKKILDIGTGSGIWPIEMAALFPNTEITGTDLSPVQPTEVPPNVHFLVDDATEDEWLWDANHFDLIHIGHMTGAMPSFKRILRQAFKHLKPGAYLECHELDPKPRCDDKTMPPENPDGGYSAFAMHDWFDLNMRSSRDADPPRQFRIAHRIEQWMKDVGFVDVEQRVSKIPTNTWPQEERLKTIGAWSESNWLEALSGWSYKPFLALAKPMSFGRHAYRHALKPPATPTLDYLWVSDDLLAATFRRFANGQRRHGSCVPGPLEARRRLAKRRNTALASIGGGPLEDISCLFGRNGREHMKWSDHSWQGMPSESQGFADHALGYSGDPVTSSDLIPGSEHIQFLDHAPDAVIIDPQIPEQILEEFLSGSDWGIEDAREFTRQMRIDLHRDPRYSRQIFDQLLARSGQNFEEAITFLDDPFLNTRGSGNYIAAIELFVRTKAKRARRTAVLDSIKRGLELGLIPTEDICLIIRTLPNILVENKKTLGSWDHYALLKHYRAMWRAIGRCNILGYHDLDKKIVDAWLGELLKIHSFRFAEEIIIETHDASNRSQWPSILVQNWLQATETDLETKAPFPNKIFSQLDVDSAADCVIRVTELISVSNDQDLRNQLLHRWRDCLANADIISTVAKSHVWCDFPLPCIENQETASGKHSTQSQIVLRLWLLRTLCRTTGYMYNQNSKPTDRPIHLLLNLYDLVVKETDGHFFPGLLREIQELDLPYNRLLILALDRKSQKSITKTVRQTLEQLETSCLSLADVWKTPSLHKGIRNIFHASFEQMYHRMDLTNRATAEELVHIARSGDSNSTRSILRLLNNNTPFKISLHKAYQDIPHPDEMAIVRYHPGPRTSRCPDPHAAIGLINQLAIAISCCRNLTPSQSFHMVHWLYGFLRRHGGPVDPDFVRAMYHAGIVRRRRDGLNIPATQYQYILWIVEKFEGRAVVQQLTAPPEVGESNINSQ
ncbi:hypothetical protein N7452_008486 [Penicillium brevicompactum]|uniref:Methyltransferase domain-containing protein n=1 Tax=Penicillium brevicompactum TaxID=5074 RepID=A0A9W9Q6S6_PENBR|nr:hypothetical protein N7452_008486 [Penicillium brevicompactum]